MKTLYSTQQQARTKLGALKARLTPNMARAIAELQRRAASDRGDVPGWVLITVMTAGLVIILWALAGNALQEMLTNAFNNVNGHLPD